MIGVKVILLPILETSAVETDNDAKELCCNLQRPIDLAARSNIRLALETELQADVYSNLLLHLDHPAAGAYYDTGNAADGSQETPTSDHRLIGPVEGVDHGAPPRVVGGTTTAPVATGVLEPSDLWSVPASAAAACPVLVDTLVLQPGSRARSRT